MRFNDIRHGFKLLHLGSSSACKIKVLCKRIVLVFVSKCFVIINKVFIHNRFSHRECCNPCMTLNIKTRHRTVNLHWSPPCQL